jgi:Tol biopolymer transport system component
MRSHAVKLVAVVVIVAGVAQAAAADPRRRAHETHGTVRLLCADARVERWPGGPLVGTITKGRDMRRYAFRGAWALGVAQGTPHYYGYVQTARFCPPSVAGRRALALDRVPTGLHVGRRASTALSAPLSRRVCSPHVWLRDHPLDRAIGILWLGDVFVVRRKARNPIYGGDAMGHEQRRGWVPRSALCGSLPRLPARSSLTRIASGSLLLTPPALLPCAAAQPRRHEIEVGVDFAHGQGVAIRADLETGAHTVRGPTFQPGEARALDRGVVGPFQCGHAAHVVYRSVGGHGQVLRRMTVEVAARRASGGPLVGRVSLPLAATSRTARSPGTRCDSKPTLVYAHGHEGPVSHRYDARPAISADGAAIAFDTPLRLSTADGDGERDVYLRDAHGLSLLSTGGRTSRAPAISADGRRVAFESDDAGAEDDNRQRDVFIWDGAGAPRLASADAAGRAANGRSRAPSLSADGGLLAFESTATDLVARAPREGIYLKDLATGATRLAIADGYRPALSADGTTLVFETAHAYAPRDHNHTVDVYALRLSDGALTLVSSARGGGAGHGRSLAGSVSSDGRFVAFMSAAPDLARGDRDGLRDVFRRDLRKRRTVLVSRDRCGGFANGYSRYPSISANGRYVAFDSHAEDVVDQPTHGEGEVYVRDLLRGATRLISARADGRPSARTAFSPALSADGRVVAFPSFGSDLVAHDDNGRVDQFSRRDGERHVRRVS